MNICHLVLWILIFLFSVFLLQLTQKFFWFSITSFISVCSLSTLFTDTNFSRLIYVLIKALDVKTSIACNLAFASSIILLWFFFFSWWLTCIFQFLWLMHKFLILPEPTRLLTRTQPMTAETKIRKYSKQFKALRTFFYDFHSWNCYVLFLLKDNFLFIYFLSLKLRLLVKGFSFTIYFFKLFIYYSVNFLIVTSKI